MAGRSRHRVVASGLESAEIAVRRGLGDHVVQQEIPDDVGAQQRSGERRDGGITDLRGLDTCVARCELHPASKGVEESATFSERYAPRMVWWKYRPGDTEITNLSTVSGGTEE